MKLLSNGFGVQRSNWAVDQHSPAGYSRVYYILSGEVTYDDGQQRKRLRHGHLYVFPATRPYQILHQPARPIECLWFHIDFFPYDIDRLLELDTLQQPTLGCIIDALLREGQTGDERAPLFLTLVEALCHAVLQYGDVRRAGEDMLKILEYMRAHFSEKELSVQRIADRFGYSAAHLIRRFGAVMGVTPHRYLSALRLSFAAERLLEGVSITRAAAESGYGEVKTFSRAFRTTYGIPPSKYERFYQPQA